MINIIAAIKELLTIKNQIQAIEKAPKSGFKTTEFWTLFLTAASSIYMGALSLIPPAWGLGIGVALSLVWLAARLLLKHYRLSLATVQGIPDVDVDALVGLLEQKFPALVPADKELKDAAKAGVDAIKADQPAPAGV